MTDAGPVTQPVVFFHVMKCGGTSVRTALALAAAGQRQGSGIFELDGQAAIAAAGDHDPTNWRFRDMLLSYVLLAMDPTIVLGHFRYRDAYEVHLGAAHFVTVLRDPVERLISLYRYRRWKDDVDVPVAVTFDEFLESGRWQKEGHAYVSTFCGRDGLDPWSDEAVAAAVENLGRFTVIGDLDRLDDFSAAVGPLIGAEVTIPKLNPSPSPEARENRDLSERSLGRAREICEPDSRVYEQVRALARTDPG